MCCASRAHVGGPRHSLESIKPRRRLSPSWCSHDLLHQHTHMSCDGRFRESDDPVRDHCGITMQLGHQGRAGHRQARETLAQMSKWMLNRGLLFPRSAAPAAKAYSAGQLRMTWLDAGQHPQRQIVRPSAAVLLPESAQPCLCDMQCQQDDICRL